MKSMIDDRFLRALLCAGSAAFAFILIDMRQEIIYFYRILRAVLFAQTAAYTAGLALLHHIGTFIL